MTRPATIRGLIDFQADASPEQPYFIAPESGLTLTYRKIRDDCVAMARFYAGLGYGRDDKVALVMPNGSQTIRLLLGTFYSGRVLTPINLLCQTSQMRYVLDHSDTRLVFVSPDQESALRDAVAGVGRPIDIIVTHFNDPELPEVVRNAGPGGSLPRVDEDDDALLMYTSGTTGVPKGVLLTHRNLLANGRNISAEHRLSASDRVMAPLPLYHINGLVVTAIAPIVHGGSVVMPNRFSAGNFWQHAVKYRCTWLNVVPTVVAYLLNTENPAEKSLDLSHIRFCRTASAPLPPDHQRAFEARFGIGVIETMGLTETAAPAFSNPYEPARRRIGSIGKPSGCEAKVIDLDGAEIPARRRGEIVIRGENVMNRYYKAPAETQGAFTRDGWLKTGDQGYRDDDGYFYITGRIKELIIKGGENIAPREIDEALLKHPAILEAAAVGVPDRNYGQDIVAFVVVREDGTCKVDELRAHCLKELGRYKTPKEFRFVHALPKGPSGKVQRLKLLELG